MALDQQREVSNGILTIRSSLDGGARVISLRGELDLANAASVESELAAALEAAEARVVVDMRELEFIDSTGIALLVAALNRCDGQREMRFVPSRAAAVNRVLSLTGVSERLPTATEP